MITRHVSHKDGGKGRVMGIMQARIHTKLPNPSKDQNDCRRNALDSELAQSHTQETHREGDALNEIPREIAEESERSTEAENLVKYYQTRRGLHESTTLQENNNTST